MNSLFQNESSTSFLRPGDISLWRIILFTGILSSVINEVTSSLTDFRCAFVNQGSGQMTSMPIEYLFISVRQRQDDWPACQRMSVILPIRYMSQLVSTMKCAETGLFDFVFQVNELIIQLTLHSFEAVWCRTIYSQVFTQILLFTVANIFLNGCILYIFEISSIRYHWYATSWNSKYFTYFYLCNS